MRMTRRITRKAGLVFALSGAVMLTACGSTKLMGKSLPDETQVIDGPSLALPPQFELRPPRKADDYESVLRAQKGIEARNLITTGTSTTTVGASAAADVSGSVPASDAWLVDKTAAQTGVVADPNVRQELVAPKTPEEVKAAKAAKGKQGLFSRWFGGSSDDED